MKQNKNSAGYTLIEMIIYVALVGIITLFIYGIILFVYSNNKQTVNLVKINSNAYSVMERIRYEVENSNYIYLPTSSTANYDYKTGVDQLSLATGIGVSSPEDIAFVDIYLENGAVFIKKEESVLPIALTSSGVVVSDLSFFYYKNDSRESVTIDITIEPKNNSNSSINLISTIALRSL
ncbi:MAG: prepilin-type N-terminal cleavage/methylation domain-containing protein [Candidatus Pacebacteria bacterium]|nr:prepilin-type N-terminal cleavage/methylation domain-containing protein [Candidatus Paceibacterota bacterium]